MFSKQHISKTRSGIKKVVTTLSGPFIVSISVLIALVLIEIGFRFYYDPARALNPDNIDDSSIKYKYDIVKNSLGFREMELDEAGLDQSTFRILLLGDSFTFGHGIEKSENRFSNIIDNQLNADQDLSASTFKVYNAGIGGTEPRDWQTYLNCLAPVFKPDIVFAVFFLRDGTNICTSLKCYKAQIQQIRNRYINKFYYRYTETGKYFADYLIRKEFSEFYINQIRNAYLGSDNEKKEWLEQQNHLLKIQESCYKLGIEFRMIIFPVLLGLDKQYAFYDVEKEIVHFATTHGIPVFSLTPGFIGQKSESLWVSNNDQHPNEAGHLLAAQIMFPFIKKTILESEKLRKHSH